MPMTPEQLAILNQYQSDQKTLIEQREKELANSNIKDSLNKNTHADVNALLLEHARINRDEMNAAAHKQSQEMEKLRKEKEIEKIKTDMGSIKEFVNSFKETESLLTNVYTGLITNLDVFEKNLISEVTSYIEPTWRNPLHTVSELNETIKTVFDFKTSYEDKDKRIRAFETYANNAFISRDAKQLTTILLASITFVAAFIGTVALAVFFPPAIALPLIIAAWATPAIIGLVGSASVKNQDDYRGSPIAAEIKNLNTKRSQLYPGLFQQARRQDEAGSETRSLLCKA